ncbi:hypothetical protein Poli38472_011571 [Pythium oligandrum]|uniref:Uncharacterized protein n=1 Tax=Pythium oligandrum TaxID=41045 RepID=A0A8K1CL32_PYTOL|nr:hypothetical protein Poli38472_011571 [Pythium oligandrum]|eukprot:TMW64691.1 hypothetical protein Poli38472_011571 [Pythium oligandrum]
MDYGKFVWQETSPGVWQREVDEAESYYTALQKIYANTGRMFFAITGHLSVTTPVPSDKTPEETATRFDAALRQAWLHLRYDYPTIASVVLMDEATKTPKKTYKAFPKGDATAAIEQWINTTFKPVQTSLTGNEWCNTDPPAPEVPTLFVVSPPTANDAKLIRRDLVLRSPHDIIDGMGSFMMFDRLAKHISDILSASSPVQVPEFGSEHEHLSPPLRVAAQIPAAVTPEIEAYLKQVALHNQAIREGVEVPPFPHRRGATLPGFHQRCAVELTEEETKTLLAKCKPMGVTPTHAVHAAIAIVNRDVQERKPEARKVRYVGFSLVNERAKCTEPYGTSEHAVAVYHSMGEESLVVDLLAPGANDPSPSAEERKQEFAGVLDIVKAFYVKTRTDTARHDRIAANWAALSSPYPATVPEIPPPPKATPSVSISSLGLVDRVLTPSRPGIEAYNPWVTGEELGNGLGMYLITFRGRMEISTAYNDAWQTKEDALGFLQRCKDVVLHGMA